MLEIPRNTRSRNCRSDSLALALTLAGGQRKKMNSGFSGDERRGADRSCFLALNSAEYNEDPRGYFIDRRALLHNGRRAQSAGPARPRSRSRSLSGHGGLLPQDLRPRTPLAQLLHNDSNTRRTNGGDTSSHAPVLDPTSPLPTRRRTRTPLHTATATQTRVHELLLTNQLAEHTRTP